MPYVVAAVTASTLLSVFTLILSLGLLRRMRAQTVQLAQLTRMDATMAAFGQDRLLAPDTVVPEFAATTTGGEPVARDLLTGPTLVAFLAPGCKPCETLLPRLIEYAERFPGGRQQVLTVLTMARPEDSAAYAERLGAVAQVVVEDGHGPVSAAYQADNLPAMYLVGSGGIILAGGVDADFFRRLPIGALANGR